MKPLAAAIDLGTTRIKAGVLDERGALRVSASRAAPPLRGTGPIRESDPAGYLREVTTVLGELERSVGAGTPLGIASQRSTFTLWEGPPDATLTPLISWQDRRAAPWCGRHAGIEAVISARTGLHLTPHYAGPKLADLLEREPALRLGMAERRVKFGTLECWILSHLTHGQSHETDLTMAARTLLADPRRGEWASDLLDLFSVPGAGLPAIVPTSGRPGPMAGPWRVAATVADQAAATLAVIGEDRGGALVNLGTGGFVLRTTGSRMTPSPGYLAGPILAARGETTRYAAEGTINGASEALARFGEGPSPPGDTDPAPGAFCIPDLAGLGAPHWLPERTLSFSPEAERLDEASKRRIVLEGILFRVREILEGLFEGSAPGRVVLSGGLALEPGLAAGLAACLERPIERLEEPEATLLGAARLAAGLPPCDPPPRTVPVVPGADGAYLPGKWHRWRGWVASELGA